MSNLMVQQGAYWIFFAGWCAVFAVFGMLPALVGIPLCLLLGKGVKVSIVLQDSTAAEIKGRNDAKQFAGDLRKQLEVMKQERGMA